MCVSRLVDGARVEFGKRVERARQGKKRATRNIGSETFFFSYDFSSVALTIRVRHQLTFYVDKKYRERDSFFSYDMVSVALTIRLRH